MFKFLLRCIAWVCLLLFCMTFGAPASFAQEQSTPVTVTILRFMEVQDPDPVQIADAIKNSPDVIGDGDYYARVRIGSAPFQLNRSNFNESKDFQPFWTFSRVVNGNGTIPVVIQMWDADENENNDDIIDLNPQDNVQDLVLNLNLASCTWTGDVSSPQRFAAGDGDHEHFGVLEGGEAGKILFDVACSQTGDIDEDGIPDGVERFGIRDMNGKLVSDMAALGADPCRPNIAVEIDYMDGAADGHTHIPSNTALTELRDAFNNAGTLVKTISASECPYAGFPTQAGGGIGLITVVDGSVPEKTPISLSTLENIRDSNFNDELRSYFHYSLWSHNVVDKNGKTSGISGVCCGGNRKQDFIVSLGSFSGQNGTDRQQSGTFMHELGHGLGLSHGGGIDIDRDRDGSSETRNCKPNYLSVMSYSFQTVGITDAAGNTAIDYSGSTLPTLNEDSLSEPLGIGDGGRFETTWADSSGIQQFGSGSLDWNGKNGIEFGKIGPVDLNAIADITDCGKKIDDKGNSVPFSTPGDQLLGWNDWKNLRFSAAMAPGKGDASIVFDEELTVEDAEANEEAWTRYLQCNPPQTGNWLVNRDCVIRRDVTAPGDLIVQDEATLQVGANVTLDIDFVNHALRVRDGSRVEVQPNAQIR